MIRLLLAALVALLVGCGGGGDDGGAAPSLPGDPAFATGTGGLFQGGTYPADQRRSYGGSVQFHSDRTVAGSLWHRMETVDMQGAVEEFETLDIFGSGGQVHFNHTLQRRSRAAGTTEWIVENSQRAGTGTIQLTTGQAAGAATLTLDFPAPDVPFGVRSITLNRVPLPDVYIGLPLAKLAGWMQFSFHSEGRSISAIVRHDAATGAFSGTAGPDCGISGMLSGYDAAAGTMRQTFAFAGAGCPATGTAEMVARLADGAILGTSAVGWFNGRLAHAGLGAPIPAVPEPFGAIAGRYGTVSQSAGALLHPNGMLILSSKAVLTGGEFQYALGEFYGRLATTGTGSNTISGAYVVRQVDFSGREVVQVGTATAVVTPLVQDGQRALSVQIMTQLRPVPVEAFTVLLTSGWSIDEPFARVSGSYSGTLNARPDMSSLVQVTIDAQGVVSGSAGQECRIDGRVLDYQGLFRMFVLEVTLQGSGCPVTGSATLLGESSTVLPAASLWARGVLGGKAVSISLQQS